MNRKPQVLVNHVGYDADSVKRAVLQAEEKLEPVSFEVRSCADDTVVCSGTPVRAGQVARWNTGSYWTLRFDEVEAQGKYIVAVQTADGHEYCSSPFMIARNVIGMRTLSDAAYYFKCQRPTGEFEIADRELPFGPPKTGTWDVRGGWADATGDIGVHMSQQTYASYFSNQQASMCAYAFFRAGELLEEGDFPYYRRLKRRIVEEAMYGAEWVMRMHVPARGFLLTKNRINSYGPVANNRQIGHDYRDRKLTADTMEELMAFYRKAGREQDRQFTDRDYEIAFRLGGGHAIASLACAARTVYPSAFCSEEYIAAAVEAFDYLWAHNEEYVNDGKRNLLDDYCTLDAAMELYRTTREWDYLRRGREMVQDMLERYVRVDDTMGYLSVDGEGRPYFHAVEEGLPVLSLLNFYRAEKDPAWRGKALDLAQKVMRHYLHITKEVANPFGYAREFVQRKNGERRTQFFFPHDTEVSPWWQGENARIASLAAAARELARLTADRELAAELEIFAADQLNWILGLNPFDSSMMYGVGRNPAIYFFKNQYDFIHVPGGICNGVTSGLHDEDGIEYVMEPTDEVNDNWRWAEQWIPHVSWYLLAVAEKLSW